MREPIASDFRPLGTHDIASLLLSDSPPTMSGMLPPFAGAALGDDGRLVAATDLLGLRQLFYAVAPGRVAVSTSSSALARWVGQGIDHRALAVQSLLGWQLGDRTMFERSGKAPCGSEDPHPSRPYRTHSIRHVRRTRQWHKRLRTAPEHIKYRRQSSCHAGRHPRRVSR